MGDDSDIYLRSFQAFLASCKDSTEYSDLTIICGDRKWDVHRLVVCSTSDWFKAACKKGFVESDTRLIELQLEDPAIVDMMIQFFYSLNYDDIALTEPENSSEVTVSNQTDSTSIESSDSSSESSTIGNQEHYRRKLARTSLLNNAFVYAMADKYQVKWLKDRAISKTWYILTEAFNPRDYCQAIETVWSTTPSSDTGLRTVYLEAFLVKRTEILDASKAETRDLWANNEFLQSAIRAQAEVLEPGESDLSLSIQRYCPEGHEGDLRCGTYCSHKTGITFKLRDNKPQTEMFSQRESKE